jgi:hypothetical protein
VYLAGARGAHDGNDAAGRDLARDVVQDGHLLLGLEVGGDRGGDGQLEEELDQEVLGRERDDDLVVEVAPLEPDRVLGRILGERARLVHLGVLGDDAHLLVAHRVVVSIIEVVLALVLGHFFELHLLHVGG